ncbi:hypothetical protein ACFLYO_11375 [Chloroflexota bacterium]
MTVTQVFEQARFLNFQERKELVKLLVDSLDAGQSISESKTGAEIVAMLNDSGPIEFVDDHIEDPVAWVKAQRQKEANLLNPQEDDQR